MINLSMLDNGTAAYAANLIASFLASSSWSNKNKISRVRRVMLTFKPVDEKNDKKLIELVILLSIHLNAQCLLVKQRPNIMSPFNYLTKAAAKSRGRQAT